MRKILFILIFLPVMFLAQGMGYYLKNNEVSQSFKERYFTKGEHDFFPMHVGDLWQYVYYDHDENELAYTTEEIVKDTVVSGNRYFGRYFSWPHNGIYRRFLGFFRVDSEGVLRVLDINDRNENGVRDEELMGDSLEVQPETEYLSYIDPYVTENHIVRDTLWRVIGNDTLFTRKVFVISGERFCTDKIGLTMIWPDQSEGVNLTGAIIDGVQYGTLVDVEETETQPQWFALYQNYPNPFNPTTTIKYTIPAIVNVETQNLASLRIYNVLGEEVATLVNEKQSPGKYSVQFDASDLPSDVYFYTLRVGNFVETKKMILLK